MIWMAEIFVGVLEWRLITTLPEQVYNTQIDADVPIIINDDDCGGTESRVVNGDIV